MIHYIRPSMVLCADDCRRQMFYRYIAGIRTETKSANTSFGTAVDVGVKQYIESTVTGKSIDPVTVFRESWSKECQNNIMAYNKLQSPEKMLRMGERMMSLLPEAWANTGMVPLMGSDGKLNLSRRLQANLAPNIILTGEIDLLGVDDQAETVLTDFKTCANESTTDFIRNSDQLTPYEILIDANKDLAGVERVDKVGLWEFHKRFVPKNQKAGKGPEILAPKLVTPRTPKQKSEYRQKVISLVEDIQRGRFFKSSRSPHNTPCNLCDYSKYCAEGNAEGLVIPQKAQQTLKLVA